MVKDTAKSRWVWCLVIIFMLMMVLLVSTDNGVMAGIRDPETVGFETTSHSDALMVRSTEKLLQTDESTSASDIDYASNLTAGSSVTCTSCEDCSRKLNNGFYDTVILSQNILNHTGDCITLSADNVVFDCSGYFISGDLPAAPFDVDYGIKVTGDNNVITNCNVGLFWYGIWLDSANSNTITGNNLALNGYSGLTLANSNNNNITANTMNFNSYGLAILNSNNTVINANAACGNLIADIWQENASGNAGSNNTCYNTHNWNDTGTEGCTHLCCLVPSNDLHIEKDTKFCPGWYNISDTGAQGAIIINASNVVLDGNGAVINGSGSGYGIYNPGFDNVIITNCTVLNYNRGIFVHASSDYMRIQNNNLSGNNHYGVEIYSSTGTSITNNHIAANGIDGILLFNADAGIIEGNVVTGNTYGLYIFDDSDSNEITDNVLTGNLHTGVYISDCDPGSWCPGGNANNYLGDNEITGNGNYGIYSQGSYTAIEGNTVCDNGLSDFASGDWLTSSGDENTCDMPNGWNDAGTTGCTYSCPSGYADLVITDIWLDGDFIWYQLRNIGNDTAPGGHWTGLLIDEIYVVNEQVTTALEPGDRYNGFFDYDWWCTDGDDALIAVADYYDQVPEHNETNNLREEVWKCDTTPPRITAGPLVQNVTQNSALITWETDEASDGLVRYGTAAGVYESEESDPALELAHAIFLDGLTPSTTYQFLVHSSDASGNSVTSRNKIFETLPTADGTDPEVAMPDPGVCNGTVIIAANATDNLGVEKVEFFIDDRLVFTDFSDPFELPLNTCCFGNGNYTLTARVVDFAGNSALKERVIGINNFVDTSAPTVDIFNPYHGATVAGQYPVWVHVEDDSGWSEVEYFVDGTKIGGGTYPVSPSLDIGPFWWDTRFLANGDYTLAVRATDETNKTGLDTVVVYVANTGPPLRPKLVVTKHTVTRHQNYFGIDLVVENQGTAKATTITITDSLKAFQPVSDTVGSVEYKGTYNPATREGQCIITDTLDLEPGHSRFYTFVAVPVLIHPNPPTPSIGDTVTLACEGPYGSSYSETVPFAIKKTTLNYPEVPLATAYKDALKEADYLIVTNPGQLFVLYSNGNIGKEEVNTLLSTMAQLARDKQGVLGYLGTHSALTLHNLLDYSRFKNFYEWYGIKTDNWAVQLHPDFTKPLGGYLLIVGEDEIVPAWPPVQLNHTWDPVNYSDHPYADTTGDGAPELIVGRAIGDNAGVLVTPLQASIGVYEGIPGYAFTREHATVMSGPFYGSFVSDVEEAAKRLQPEFAVKTMHWKDYFEIANFSRDYQQDDGFAVGDVLGGLEDEIIIGDESANKIFVYDANGTQLKEFACGFGGTDFEAGDRIVAGDHNIVLADHSADQILVYNGNGILQTNFGVDFEPFDGLAMGDVAGGGSDEIVIADRSADKIFLYTISGVKLGTEIAQTYDKYDGFAVGDVTGDAAEEIVIADRSANKLRIYSGSGTFLGSNDVASQWLYEIGDGSVLAVGNVYSGGKNEIIIAPAAKEKRWIYIYSWNASGGMLKENAPISFNFEASDALATGDIGTVMGKVQDEVFVADRDGSIRIFDTINWMSRLNTSLPDYTRLADVIFVSAHGSPAGWGQFGGLSTYPGAADYVPSFDFGNHNPLVFSAACLTGNYAVGGKEDRNVAETMLANGSAVFIGSTEVSWGPPNREGAWKFFTDWDAGECAGEVYTAMERSYWNANSLQKDWRFWITEYNYYGDPKFGGLSGGILGNAEAVWQSGLEGSVLSASSESLEVSVPDYVVYKDHFGAGLDRVEIPGGQVWLEPGTLMVPFYSVFIDYPRGYKIHEVLLINRSGLVNDTGVNVPMAPSNITPCVCDPVPYSGTVEGFFPEDTYWWEVVKNPDGSSTVVVTAYPFYYNPLTTDVKFYKNYSFAINYTESAVTVEVLKTDKDAYVQGETVTVDVGLNNTGDPQDVVISVLIKRYGSAEIIGGLLLSTLTNFTGPATYSPQWNSSDCEPGYYTAEVVARDTEGTVLDTETDLFRLGVSSGEITAFSATPECFEVGDVIAINMTFANTGTVNLTGTAIVRVIDVTGSMVNEYRHNVTDLLPSDSICFRDTWNTSSATEGLYSILGYVLYEGRSTDPVSVMIGTETGGFDTGQGTYPSIAGTHTGTITPNQTMVVSSLYTYPCSGTGGHTEYVKIWQGTETLVEETWGGYHGDWQNITFDTPVVLEANETYYYTITTGSYPQIIHAERKDVAGGTIACTQFTDSTGNVYVDWIPAIRLK